MKRFLSTYAVSAIAITLCWLATVFAVPWVALRFPRMFAVEPNVALEDLSAGEKLALAGSYGDMFGAADALFSGLALAGVALTLFLQFQANARGQKPFLVPSFVGDEARIEIRSPQTSAGEFFIPLRIALIVENASSEIGLDVRAAADLEDIGVRGEVTVDAPLVSRAKQVIDILLSVPGRQMSALLDGLESSVAKVVLSLELSYANVNMAKWTSSVKYKLTLAKDSAVQDVALVRGWLDHSGDSEDEGFQRRGVVILHPTVLNGSWRHSEK